MIDEARTCDLGRIRKIVTESIPDGEGRTRAYLMGELPGIALCGLCQLKSNGSRPIPVSGLFRLFENNRDIDGSRNDFANDVAVDLFQNRLGILCRFVCHLGREL